MTTITTKQLRENMSQIVADLQKGQPVRLSYRHKIIGVLQPMSQTSRPLRRGSSEAILSTLESINLGPPAAHIRSSHKTFKEEIRELRERDLG